ncbi:MAG: hypothetical protein AM326_06390 [Candidatus Thorarchaeota archaeon SMTZ-45]|nr:MAG: hypothetical protein AM325_00135 [Candidatus Thorarchaeota archaeon SMTZ1-45]KXH76871.1 MAG: hypothetical protein AM326_06390 [Candidatus Thorarchaeota archaeon SMTZ-45]
MRKSEITENTQTKSFESTRLDKATLGGTLLYIGSIQWFLGLLLAEAWYPGYSSRIDYVSDLGVGPTALIYNVSVFLLGLCMFLSAYFMMQSIGGRVQSILLAISGIGAMGVGVFPYPLQPWHSIFTLIAILFGAFAAISSYQKQKPPISYISVVLGLFSLIAAIIFFPYLGLPVGATDTFLGMAKGSMERWAIYPILSWAIGHGSHIARTQSDEYI